MLDNLMDPNRPEKLTIAQLESEAEDILIAGSDTTALTLTYASVYLARQPEVWEQLYQEIKPVYGPSDQFPTTRQLESVPLLMACIKESLRLSTPVPSYLWRTVPVEDYQFTHGGKTYDIPAGTSIGMSPWNQHYNEELFPEPTQFKPERWLGAAGGALDQYLVVFSKGTRGCGGLNLAWMEMYLALAAMVIRFRVKGEADPGKPLVQRDQFVGLLIVSLGLHCR
jgi:cytochrome P450